MIRRLLFLMALVLGLACTALAAEPKVGDSWVEGVLKYEVTQVTPTLEVEVDELTNPDYSGSLDISSTVNHDGKDYAVTSIGEYACAYCIFLTGVKLPNSVTSIGKFAFADCDELGNVEFPNSLASIGEAVFSACSLTSVTIPSTVSNIGSGAFEYSLKLLSINVDAGNQHYSSKDGILYSNDGKTLHTYPAGKKESSYEMPASVSSIGDFAFYGSPLETIQLSSTLNSIGFAVFADVPWLATVKIPSSVSSISPGAFAWCASLETIEIDEDNEHYCVKDGLLFSKDGKTLHTYPPSRKNASYEVPSSVTRINAYAFAECPTLKSVTIPSSVVHLGKYAFYYVEDPSPLESVYIPAATPPECEGNLLFGSTVKLYVPQGSLDAYKKADGWKDHEALMVGKPTHNISFNLDGGNLEGKDQLSPVQVFTGTAIADPGTPTKQDHTFKGWWQKGGEKYDFGLPVQGDISLIAHWENNGSGDPSENGSGTNDPSDPSNPPENGGSTTDPTNPDVDTPVSKASPASLTISPNPASSSVRIEGLSSPASISIYTLAGRLLRSETLLPDASMDVSDLPAGIYLVRVQGLSLRLVKQ